MSERTLRLDAVRDHLEDIIGDTEIAVELGIIFGSRVRDDATETSDTDVLLVSPDFVGVPGHRRAAPLLERWDHARYGAVDVLCYTPEEYCEFRERNEQTLPDRALAEGVVFRGEPDGHDQYRLGTQSMDNER
jgi:predicted nucleotidyltransferase